MNIPALGEVTKDEIFEWYYSQPVIVRALGGKACRIVVKGYDDDNAKEEYAPAIQNFLALSPEALKSAESHVFAYYKDCFPYWHPSDPEYVVITSPSDVWGHVQLGDEPMVTRRKYGDKGIYISLECNCDWEPEHGLQIVFKNGENVTKVGPYDGHLTNSDAFADENLENVVYRSA